MCGCPRCLHSADDTGAADCLQVFDTTLSAEYALAASALGFSRAETWRLAFDSIEQIFAGPAVKAALRAEFVAEAV